jgi:hypothetical protein
MAENPFTKTESFVPAPVTAAPAPAPIDRALVAQSDPLVMSGASWFWWIAGLSVVNSIMLHSGSDRGFVIGLGFTFMADAIFREMKFIAFAIDAIALGVICGLGFMSRKGHLWAFITGIVLYSLDALIYVAFQDWMAAAFHGLALFYMIRGAKALRAALKAAAEPLPATATPPPIAGA